MHKRSSGGSRHSMNNALQTRGAMQDPQTYGMLMWQSKLQEKLLQEQKEKRQKELEEQQKRIKEREQSEEHENRRGQQQRGTTPEIEIPQMIPGPAPYTVSGPSPLSPLQTMGESPMSPNGQQGVDQPMFPNISNRIRTSMSCDNFGRALPGPASVLGNIVSFKQMGGAGSPRRTPSGKIVTILRGDPEIRYHQKDTRGFDQTIRYLMDREKVSEYKLGLDRQLEEQRKWRRQVGSAAIKEITRKGFIDNGPGNNGAYTSGHGQNYQYSPGSSTSERVMGTGNNKNGIELAPLMRKFNSLPKLNTLSSTDVTRPYVHSPRNESFQLIQPNEVAETLSSQLKEKEWLTRKHQEKERLATERHFQTWDSLWGRPGCGAPAPFPARSLGPAVSFGNLYADPQQHRTGHNRVNLFKALHMTHQQNRPK